MSRPWVAEREVPPGFALALIREQFPQLGAGGIQPLGSGWDNTAYVVDGVAVFRFPRKASTVALLERPERQGNSSIVALVRRRLGAVGHSCIVPYCARSPTRSAAQGHAQIRRLRRRFPADLNDELQHTPATPHPPTS